MPGGVLESVLSANLGAYSQAGRECAIECYGERTVTDGLGVCHRVQLGASLGAYWRV